MTRPRTIPLPNPQGTAGENIPAILGCRLKEFYAHRPGPEPDPEQLHQLRIAARRLRYSLEFCRPPFGRVLDETIVQIKALQEVLGDIHDLDVLAKTMAELADDTAPGVQRLHEHMAERRALLLVRFHEQYCQITHPEFRQWIHDLLGQLALSLSSR